MDQDEFSNAIEHAFKEALKQADAITANAETIRKQAELELDAAKAARTAAEKVGEQMAQDYFEGRQTQFKEAARTELLRNLVRKHLEAGKSSEEIVAWLDVTPDFVSSIDVVIQRVADLRSRSTPALSGNPRVHYEQNGRGGTIVFENDQTRFDMWWEFAGGDALVIVDIPTTSQWTARTKLPLSDREGVLLFICERIVKDQISGEGAFLIGDNVITFYAGRK
jgi:hypothetical protein